MSPGAPRSENVWKTLEKLHILRPREAPGGLQEGPGRTPGGPREAPRSIPRLHMSTKGLQEFRCFRFPHVSSTKNANSEARRCSVSNSFTFSRGKMQKGQSVSAAEHCKTRVKVRSLKFDVGAHDLSDCNSLTFSHRETKHFRDASKHSGENTTLRTSNNIGVQSSYFFAFSIGKISMFVMRATFP